MSGHLLALLLGTLLDRLVGDPPRLWRRLPHPVVLVGKAVNSLDRGLNRIELAPAERRRNGILACLVLTGGAAVLGLVLHRLFALAGPLGWLLEALVLAVFLAQKSLTDHVRAVAEALDGGGLFAGRRAVAEIVGRDPDQLDEAGVCRAAIESLAENASDGVVAPWLFFLVLGLPGLLAYKAVNTADSMIGHMSERHRDFGWASAKLDDLLNLPASRLTALLFAAAAGLEGGLAAARRVFALTRRDAGLHRSPNAGWPEAAAAAALDLAVGGPRRYGELIVDAPLLHREGRRAATSRDIAASIDLFRTMATLLAAISALLFAVSLA